MKGHAGFRAVAGNIAESQHLPLDRARAILASRTRMASPAARRHNPRLNRVKRATARAKAFGG